MRFARFAKFLGLLPPKKTRRAENAAGFFGMVAGWVRDRLLVKAGTRNLVQFISQSFTPPVANWSTRSSGASRARARRRRSLLCRALPHRPRERGGSDNVITVRFALAFLFFLLIESVAVCRVYEGYQALDFGSGFLSDCANRLKTGLGNDFLGSNVR